METSKMKETIEKIEQLLSEMKEEYEKELERKYRASEHKSFKPGDWIYNGDEWGKVGWTENSNMSLPEEAGYVGINLFSGSRGFKVCKRDDWSLMEYSDTSYLEGVHNMCLTGEEIQEILSIFYCRTTSLLGDKIREQLKSTGQFSFNKK